MSDHGSSHPPGPRGKWLVGNAPDYEADRIGFLRRCQAEYGDVFSFSPSVVFVGDPALVHHILERTNDEYAVESPVFGKQRIDARLERQIDGWMRSRNLGSAAISRPVTRAHGRRLLEAFDATIALTGGREFDVWQVMHAHGGAAVVDFLFGPQTDDELVAVTERRSRLIGTFLNSDLTVPRWLPLPSVRRAVRAEAALVNAVTARVDERLVHRHHQPEDMLDLLLTDPDAAADPVRQHIIAMLTVNMIASVGSPGTALSWIVCELARNPQLHELVHDEAWRSAGSVSAGSVSAGSVLDDRQLIHSKAFVREILRLYPPAWLMGRLVRRDCTLGGYRLRAGQEVMFSPYLTQRDPRWWPEPDRFRPQRWLEGGSLSPEARRSYIPFGSGPRMCMGLHVSLYQLVTTTSHLAARYRIESNAAEIEPYHHAMVVPRGLRARITAEAGVLAS